MTMQTGMEPEFILFFNCPEAVMEKRLMGRNEGRTDDNAETIRKRFKVTLALFLCGSVVKQGCMQRPCRTAAGESLLQSAINLHNSS